MNYQQQITDLETVLAGQCLWCKHKQAEQTKYCGWNLIWRTVPVGNCIRLSVCACFYMGNDNVILF